MFNEVRSACPLALWKYFENNNNIFFFNLKTICKVNSKALFPKTFSDGRATPEENPSIPKNGERTSPRAGQLFPVRLRYHHCLCSQERRTKALPGHPPTCPSHYQRSSRGNQNADLSYQRSASEDGEGEELEEELRKSSRLVPHFHWSSSSMMGPCPPWIDTIPAALIWFKFSKQKEPSEEINALVSESWSPPLPRCCSAGCAFVYQNTVSQCLTNKQKKTICKASTSRRKETFLHRDLKMISTSLAFSFLGSSLYLG